MLEKKLDELGKYFDGMFRLPNGYNGVRIIIPNTWSMYDKITNEFEIKSNKLIDNGVTKILFVGNDKAKLTDIIDFAIEVISNNLEREVKKELFNSKVIEMAKIFDTNKLSTLQTLVFKFEKIKKNKVKEDDSKIIESIIDETNDVNTMIVGTENIADEEIESMINSAINEMKNK